MRCLAILQVIFIISLLVMSGCGRKGDPRPPERIVNERGTLNESIID